MSSWSETETHSTLALGKRRGVLLVAIGIYCVAVGLLVHRFDIRIADWGGGASLINTVILSLLLGFRNRVAYDRWWEARKLWGQLTNDSRNLATKIAAFVPSEKIARSRAAALISGFAHALKSMLRGESLQLRELPGLELETAVPEHAPLYLAGQLYAVVSDWKRAGLVDEATLWILDRHLHGLLDVCGGCERIRNTPLSPSYKALLRGGLILNVLAAPWLTMAEIGFWGVPIFELVCFFLLGVEIIDSVVEEPFGYERDDLDLDRYCQTIIEGVRATLRAES
jgi:putative membrane protein